VAGRSAIPTETDCVHALPGNLHRVNGTVLRAPTVRHTQVHQATVVRYVERASIIRRLQRPLLRHILRTRCTAHSLEHLHWPLMPNPTPSFAAGVLPMEPLDLLWDLACMVPVVRRVLMFTRMLVSLISHLSITAESITGAEGISATGMKVALQCRGMPLIRSAQLRVHECVRCLSEIAYPTLVAVSGITFGCPIQGPKTVRTQSYLLDVSMGVLLQVVITRKLEVSSPLVTRRLV